MKKLLALIFMAFPLLVAAQDNTWERIETEEAAKTDRDAKYLKPNAVPLVDNKVCFQKTIKAPGKSAKEIYDILLKQLSKMVKEPNQLENSLVALTDSEGCQLGAVFHEWLVFKQSAFSLDRTQLNFQLTVSCSDGMADVKMTRITYLYDEERNPTFYTAEEWITDKACVNKKHTKLYPISGKFRRKTIDRKDFIFKKFKDLLNKE